MEIYEPGQKQTQTNPEKRVFPVSVLNFRLPLWEKAVFFLIGWAGFQVISLVCNLIISFFYNLGGMSAELANCLLMFFTYLFTLGLFVLVMAIDKRNTLQTFLQQFKHPQKYLLYGLLAFGAIMIVEVIYSNIFAYALPNIYGANTNQSSIESMVTGSPVLLFFPIVIFAPITEELTYRIGLVDTIGHEPKHRWLGIILSAVIFGLIHFDWQSVVYYIQYNSDYQTLLQLGTETEETLARYKEAVEYFGITCINEVINLPIYIFSGLAFAYSYAKTGLISTSISGHAINNLVSYIMMVVAAYAGSSACGALSTGNVINTALPLLL